jgi:peptidyl-prolyl cis-trans isomerase SurA
MKFKYLPILLLLSITNIFSQENSEVLFSIDNKPVYVQEFINGYQKSTKQITNSDNNIEDYLKLFIDFKLKVKEAKMLGLDTLPKFKAEVDKYKDDLILPYLKDKKVTEKLVLEAYNRLRQEVNVSHILIFSNIINKDTINSYNKLVEARNLILGGANFREVAQKYSKDPSVKENGGDIGYFTALQMVYPFENIAFNTAIDEVSMPFRTKFGFHILKVNDKRVNKGEVEVAHIMFKNDDEISKKKIDSIYKILVNQNPDFYELAKKVSEDKASAIKGGRLNKFTSGQMIEEFSKIAFSLEESGEISEPFLSQFGWHIVKLIKKYPIDSFESLKSKLRIQVEKDARSNLITKSVIDKLIKKFNIVIDRSSLEQLNNHKWKSNTDIFNEELFSINDHKIYQNDFVKFLKSSRGLAFEEAFSKFKENEVLSYYKSNLEHLNSEFLAIFKEFKEGLLLFELLETQVWEKAKEVEGYTNYYSSNKDKKYIGKELKEIKGEVISDYQNYLDELLIQNLRDKYKVAINKSEKRKLKKLNL